jgi:hypothetical protein
MEINQDGYDGFTLDIQVYRNYGDNCWAQAHYLVHGVDDVMWTDSLDEAIEYLKQELKRPELVGMKND